MLILTSQYYNVEYMCQLTLHLLLIFPNAKDGTASHTNIIFFVMWFSMVSWLINALHTQYISVLLSQKAGLFIRLL